MPILNPPLVPPVSMGLIETIEALGHYIEQTPAGAFVDDNTAVQAIISSYVGSATELAWERASKQIELDAFLNKNFDLLDFIRAGVNAVTATSVSNFLSSITNNYRTKRTLIATAVNVTAVRAIDVTMGWPSNP